MTTQAPDKNRSNGYISERLYGEKAKSRVAHGAKILKGGGRYMVGKPYVVKGKRYYPKEDPSYDKNGVASWYGSAFQGRHTANGELYDADNLSAAHPTLPLPSYVRVTNLETGSSIIVRVNDRGPYHKGRIIDVSRKAADMLDIKRGGTASVRVQFVGRARLGGHDTLRLMASYVKKSDQFPAVNPAPQIATAMRRAANQSMGPWRSVTIASLGHEIEPMPDREVQSPISMETDRDSKVHNPLTPAVIHCSDKDRHDGVRDMCWSQVLALPGINRNMRLVGVIVIRRRRSSQRSYRRQQSVLPSFLKGASWNLPSAAVEPQQSGAASSIKTRA
ncbi:hypothetical protein ATY79_14590 [Rhizobium sp. R693]|nr:hypothetical protein ATY79_14590 [Rhizobium sp. R693]